MKIINRKEFLVLEESVVFSKYTPSIFDGFYLKLPDKELAQYNSFLYQDLIAPLETTSCLDKNINDPTFIDHSDACDMAEKQDMPLDFNCCDRDGYYDDDQLFAIYSKEDVEKLIKCLQAAL